MRFEFVNSPLATLKSIFAVQRAGKETRLEIIQKSGDVNVTEA